MPSVLNDDDGNRIEQIVDSSGDEQHASTNPARNNDPQRAVEFRQEDACLKLLYINQTSYDKEYRGMIFIQFYLSFWIQPVCFDH